MSVLRLPEVLFILVVYVPHVIAVSDVLRTPTSVWRRADQSQTVWLIVTLFVLVFGPLVYWLYARPKLAAAR